jgi:hypothetical protein
MEKSYFIIQSINYAAQSKLRNICSVPHLAGIAAAERGWELEKEYGGDDRQCHLPQDQGGEECHTHPPDPVGVCLALLAYVEPDRAPIHPVEEGKPQPRENASIEEVSTFNLILHIKGISTMWTIWSGGSCHPSAKRLSSGSLLTASSMHSVPLSEWTKKGTDGADIQTKYRDTISSFHLLKMVAKAFGIFQRYLPPLEKVFGLNLQKNPLFSFQARGYFILRSGKLINLVTVEAYATHMTQIQKKKSKLSWQSNYTQ